LSFLFSDGIQTGKRKAKEKNVFKFIVLQRFAKKKKKKSGRYTFFENQQLQESRFQRENRPVLWATVQQ